jgi:hypothetical protein
MQFVAYDDRIPDLEWFVEDFPGAGDQSALRRMFHKPPKLLWLSLLVFRG